MLYGNQPLTDSYVFRPEIKPKTFHTRNDNASHYTTDAVEVLFVLELQTYICRTLRCYNSIHLINSGPDYRLCHLDILI